MVFPEVSLSLDCLVEEGEDDNEQESIENTENGEATGLRVRARTCSNKYLHSQNIEETNKPTYHSFIFFILLSY